MKKLIIYWFRNDLRVDDNLALNHTCALAKQSGAAVLPVFCHTAGYGALRTNPTSWGFARISPHRQQFSGALSAAQIIAALNVFEAQHGKSESSYWIWFELLWRDYFRFLHYKYGAQLYRARGLSKTPVSLPAFDEQKFLAWTLGPTGETLVDAAMRELASTAYLSNRLRQQVLSYWLHELSGDRRVAAAWLESQLLDYDVYSNQGNCLYLAGLGIDPRGYLGGRWFDPQKQAKQHDAGGEYRRIWNAL
jgi:deoxyribodipyrimidine photo-lyase